MHRGQLRCVDGLYILQSIESDYSRLTFSTSFCFGVQSRDSPSWQLEVVGHTASAVRKQQKKRMVAGACLRFPFESLWNLSHGVTPFTVSVSVLSSVNSV